MISAEQIGERSLWCVPAMSPNYDEKDPKPRFIVRDLAAADVVSSFGHDGKHYPVLDLDMPCVLIESETPGHHHLLIDHPIEWDDYAHLLGALEKCGLIEKGYAAASIERGQTFVAVRPWKAAKAEAVKA